MMMSEAFLSPLDGAHYHRGIVPSRIRYVLYLDSDFLRAAKMTPSDPDQDIANTLFLGTVSGDDLGNPRITPLLRIGQGEYYFLGHRVWDHRVHSHLLKKLSWASIAGQDVEQTVPEYITTMERNLDWIGSFNFVWKKGGLNVLREPLTEKDFQSRAQVWKFSEKGKIYDR